MAAKANFRVCPACGTRNKLAWEFCVRCGESVSEVPPGESTAPASSPEAADAVFGRSLQPPPEAETSGVGGLFSVLMVIGLAAAAFVSYRYSLPKDEIAASVFTGASLATSLPPARSVPPEADELDEGLRLLRGGQARDSLSQLAQAQAGNPDDPEANYRYAQALWATGSRDRAYGFYATAARLSPESLTYQSDLAKVAVVLGHRPEAIAAYRAVLAQEPDAPAALNGLAQLLLDTGELDEAVQLLSRAAGNDPKSVKLGTQLAYALERARRPADAEAAYRRVLAVDPKADVARARLVEVLFKAGRPDDAMEVVQDALKADPKQPGVQRSLATLLERTGHPAEAAAAYREYVKLAPNASDARALEERANELEQSASAGQPAPSTSSS